MNKEEEHTENSPVQACNCIYWRKERKEEQTDMLMIQIKHKLKQKRY